jgi:hypothetical protein
MPLVAARRGAVEHRDELRQRVGMFELICLLLLLEEIEPESTCLIRRLREAEAELAAIPDTPALRRADEEYLARVDTGWVDEEWERGRRYRPPPCEETTPASEVQRLIGRYRTDITDKDLAKASPIELLAWCLSRHGATIEEAAGDIAEAADDLLLFLDELPDDAAPDDPERADLAEENQ